MANKLTISAAKNGVIVTTESPYPSQMTPPAPGLINSSDIPFVFNNRQELLGYIFEHFSAEFNTPVHIPDVPAPAGPLDADS